MKKVNVFLEKWRNIQLKARQKGILLTDHASRNMIGRKITLEQLEDIYKNGIKYWNPKGNQYIILKDNKYLALDPKGSGKIVTIVTNKPTKTFLNQLIKK